MVVGGAEIYRDGGVGDAEIYRDGCVGDAERCSGNGSEIFTPAHSGNYNCTGDQPVGLAAAVLLA